MIIRVPSDSGDPQYDFYVVADDNLYSLQAAISLVDKTIESVKAAHPEDYQFEDFVEALPEGIKPADIYTCNLDW